MTRIENYKARRVPWITILIAICWLLLAAGIWHTAAHFAPQMRQIELDMADMQDRLDAMLTEVEAMRDD